MMRDLTGSPEISNVWDAFVPISVSYVVESLKPAYCNTVSLVYITSKGSVVKRLLVKCQYKVSVLDGATLACEVLNIVSHG